MSFGEERGEQREKGNLSSTGAEGERVAPSNVPASGERAGGGKALNLLTRVRKKKKQKILDTPLYIRGEGGK